MRDLSHPTADSFELSRVLHALSDPDRLAIVRALAHQDWLPCSALHRGRPKSSMTHHFRTLREAGLIRTRQEGTSLMQALRFEDLQARFPGLLQAILTSS